MKHLLLFLTALILCFDNLQAQSQKADSIIGELLNKNEMLELNRNYPMLKKEVHPFLQSMSEALLANSLNKPSETCLAIENLIKNYQNMMDFSTVVNMFYLWANNMQYLGMYQEARDLLDGFLKQIPTEYGKDIAPLFNATIRYCNILKNYSQSNIYLDTKEDCVLPIKISTFEHGSLISLPVTINNTTEDFIFDTGAEGNAVSEAFAKRHQIKVIGDSIATLGAITMYSKLGLIDSLKIGNIVYKNVPVNILPPSPDDKIFKTNAILGLPFLKAIKEIRIRPNEKLMIIPKQRTQEPDFKSNILLSNNQLCIETTVKEKQCLFSFDTGSTSSYFNNEYFKMNTEYIETFGKKEKRLTGGFGMLDSIETYRIPINKVEVGGITFENLQMDVRMYDNLIDQQSRTIGVLGSDLLLKCNEVIINVDKMFAIFSSETKTSMIIPTYKYIRIPSLFAVSNGEKWNQSQIPPTPSLPLREPTLFYRLNKKWGNIQKMEYTFDLNTMKWQSYYANTLIRIDK